MNPIRICRTVATLALLVTAPSMAQKAQRPLLRQERIEAMLEGAEKLLGVEYRFGAAPSRNDAVDCSSLVLKVFDEIGVVLPRTAFEQSKLGLEVPLTALRRGDRLYFKMTDRNVPIDHTALYLGEGRMLHAFPGKGVSIEPIEDYESVLKGARR